MNKQEGYGCVITNNDLNAYHKALDEVESYLKSMLYRFCSTNQFGVMESSRIKKMQSIIEKIFGKKKDNDNVNIENEINDIAGIRVVFCATDDACNLAELDKKIHAWDKETFKKKLTLSSCKSDNCNIDVIYQFINYLRNDNSYEVVNEKDYIKSPKSRGYQSYHIIIKASNGCSVEIQVRNLVQHLFAEYEHEVFYKASSSVRNEYDSFCNECVYLMNNAVDKTDEVSGYSKTLNIQ